MGYFATLEEIPEGWEPEQTTEDQNDFGKHGYGGLNPTGQEQTHRFRLYVLETTLRLPPVTEKADLVAAVYIGVIRPVFLINLKRNISLSGSPHS